MFPPHEKRTQKEVPFFQMQHGGLHVGQENQGYISVVPTLLGTLCSAQTAQLFKVVLPNPGYTPQT